MPATETVGVPPSPVDVVLDDIRSNFVGLDRNIDEYLEANNALQCTVSIMIARPTKVRIPERTIRIPSVIADVVETKQPRKKQGSKKRPAGRKRR
jgi:hypothetical protein